MIPRDSTNGRQPGRVLRSQAGIAAPIVGMGLVIVGLLALGWGMFFRIVLPGEYMLPGQGVFSTGLAITAFTLGLRHGFDPDHIAAIDNVTRKLVADGKRPVSVGFWFALGHSTVVVVTVILIALGMNLVARELTIENSTLTTIASIWGALISGFFLLLIGLINLVSLREIWKIFRRNRRGETVDHAEIDHILSRRGIMARILGPVSRRVDAPWKMYVVGILFGLGFDTATTIALFVVGGAAALTAPWYVVLVLPILFMAGMTLVDTIDGIVMHHAYSWAFAAPARRIYYNLTVTLISVALAFLVGGVGLISHLAEKLGAEAGALGWVAGLEFENVGFIVVGALVCTWLVAAAWWRLAKAGTGYGGSGDHT